MSAFWQEYQEAQKRKRSVAWAEPHSEAADRAPDGARRGPGANVLLAFIQRHVRATGKFPSNAEITAGAQVPPYRVSSMLTHLVERGDLTRAQIASKGLRNQPKYRYALANRNGTMIGKPEPSETDCVGLG